MQEFNQSYVRRLNVNAVKLSCHLYNTAHYFQNIDIRELY